VLYTYFLQAVNLVAFLTRIVVSQIPNGLIQLMNAN